ncbi:MAG TPA: hypothetical protein VKA46_02465 [Gemmataceae bacterium]|nr:hypothetical protein [Gemmataceae bacterium]
MARKTLVFKVASPLGYRVVLTRNRWREIIRYKHPALAGHEAAVRECITDPEVIRESAKDPEIHLYYRAGDRGHLCVVVGCEDPDERFVVTAYFTKNIKKGRELWTK